VSWPNCSPGVGLSQFWASSPTVIAATKTSTSPRWRLAQSSHRYLRRAERDGLIVRHLDPGRVETATLYRLTDLGRSLNEPLVVLERWTEWNWQSVEAARRRWDELRQAGR
jgi:DNA-binding PadR family transcriptional regulator